MQNSWRIGFLFGIPLYIDSSWLIILLLVTAVNASELNARGLLVGTPIWGWITGLIMALLLFGSVLLHELGHSLVAKAQGITVKSITLFLFGGIAAIEREAKNPKEALQVAIAGPLVSIALYGVFLSLSYFSQENSLINFLTTDLARINLILAVFNLIPGLPLDGGQVLKAIVWKITGDRFAGVHTAATTGKFIGSLAMAVGFFFLLLTGEIATLWLSLIGWFVWRNANTYDRLTSLQETLLKVVAAEVMTSEFRVVNAHLTLQEFATEYILTDTTRPLPYYAAAEGRYQGLLVVKDLQQIERSEWDRKTLADIARPLTAIPSVTEKTPLAEVINALEAIAEPEITVLSPAGAVAGVIDRGDIIRAIAIKENLSISEAEIKQIKAEGAYPPGLQLAAIAKNIET